MQNVNSNQLIRQVRSSTGRHSAGSFDRCSIDNALRMLSLSSSSCSSFLHQKQTATATNALLMITTPTTTPTTTTARRLPRRLPSVPLQRQRSAQSRGGAKTSTSLDICELLHIVTHEYIGADCALRPGERLVVVDNGDPDWKHGFKLDDHMERLFAFPSTCVAAYRPEERPMRLVRNCNLVDQKIRMYRDQIVFVQPNSLDENRRVLVRNEHNKMIHCPIQFLTTLA